MKYTFFYPENGDMVMEIAGHPVTEFLSLAEAQLFLEHVTSDWKPIETQNDFDKAAYMDERTGDVIVLRQLLA